MRNDHRTEGFLYELLTLDGGIVGVLDVEPGGSLLDDRNAKVRGSASLQVTTYGETDWENSLIRISYQRQGYPDYPLLTGLPSVGEESYPAGRISTSIELYDLTQPLADEELGKVYGVAAGVDPMPQIIALIEETLPHATLALPTEGVPLTASIVQPENTSKLDLINKVLKAQGFSELMADGRGTLVSEPELPYNQRPVQWDFRNDETSLFTPDWSRGTNRSAIPNEVRLIRATEGGAPADIAVARNEDPDSPWSIPRRGRVLSVTEKDVAAATFPILQEEARRSLQERTRVVSSVNLRHPVLGYRAGQVITFTHTRLDGLTRRYVCDSLRYTLAPGALVDGTYSEVITDVVR